jgi:hypothetical protein
LKIQDPADGGNGRGAPAARRRQAVCSVDGGSGRDGVLARATRVVDARVDSILRMSAIDRVAGASA